MRSALKLQKRLDTRSSWIGADASAIAKLLGAYGEVREARGEAKLLEL